MTTTIHAVFQNGVFRPMEPIDLPEDTTVAFEPRVVTEAPQAPPPSTDEGIEGLPYEVLFNHLSKYPRSTAMFIAGGVISFFAMLIRLNARAIAWPKTASWGAQVEATPFYATQLAIADVSDLFLAFGLVLVAAVAIRALFVQRGDLAPFQRMC